MFFHMLRATRTNEFEHSPPLNTAPPVGGQPFVLLPKTSDEKVTTGKMGYGQ